MILINERNMIAGEEIHRVIQSKLKRFDLWLKEAMNNADLQEGKDFCRISHKSTGGRPRVTYEFSIEAAKEICLLEKNDKGKEIRRWLIGLSNQRDNLELVTVKEAAMAMKVVNCLKYVDNQREAYSMHRKAFVAKNGNMYSDKWIYAEFAKYRASIVGWNKQQVDEAITNYLTKHIGYNKNKLIKSDMATKLSVLDIGEAIRIAVLDILFSKDSDEQLASKFSELCKRFAKEMQVQADKSNQNTLFQIKDSEVKKIEQTFC